MTCWKDSFIALDVETTGLFDSARIVEIGFAWFEDRKLARSFATLINPGDIDFTAPDVASAMEVNAISPEDLKSAPTFEQVMRGFMVQMGRDPWVMHNAPFDLRMLGLERKRLEASTRMDWGPYVPRPLLKLDSLLLAFHLHKGLESYSLSSVSRHLDIEATASHRALDDAKVCGEVLVRLADRLPDDAKEINRILSEAKAEWDARKGATDEPV